MNKKFYLLISIFFSIIIWVSIALSDSYYSSYILPLKIIDVPDNFTPSLSLPEHVKIKIKSQGWKLLPLEFGTQKYFFVSAKNDSNKFSENLIKSLDLNPWYNNSMNIIEIIPQSVEVNFERKIEKLVKVKPVLDLKFNRDFGLASEVLSQPDSILLKGPYSEITKINEVETEPISIKNLEKKTEIFAQLKNYRGFETDIQSVKLFLDVQRIIENTISDVPIRIENMPKNIEVVLIPNTLNLTLRGGIEYFSKYNNTNIIATIDYKNVSSDTLGYLRPEIQIPKNFHLISVKPDIIRYIIKKY